MPNPPRMYPPCVAGIYCCMANLKVQRGFRWEKLKQVFKLAWESHIEPITGQPGRPAAVGPGQLGIMFLGHSSFLLQFGQTNLLVDPVFATRLILLRRQRRPGVRIADLPAIDAILLTHAHMDHLNRPTLRRIVRATRRRTGRAPMAIVPQGVADLVQDLGFSQVRSLEWWQSTKLADLTVTLTPAKHWGARMFTDTHRLFGGYVVASTTHSVYHSGDTAWFAGFAEIASRLAPPAGFDAALLPIGAYFPDSYRAVHTSPEEALRAFTELRAQVMVPMHFGTFRLGREPMHEPPIRLLAEAARLGLTSRIRILTEGETLTL